MESQTLSKLEPLNSKSNFTEKILNIEENDIQSTETKTLSPRQLLAKRSLLLSSDNNPEKEKDFRQTCSSNLNDIKSNTELNEAYQEYIKSYNKLTSLYLLGWTNYCGETEDFSHCDWTEESKDSDISNLAKIYIFNTENEKETAKVLKVPKTLHFASCITQIPNDELLFFEDRLYSSGRVMVIDNNYKVRRVPCEMAYRICSAIYFNKGAYCVGEYEHLPVSTRFDLEKNRWLKLTPMQKNDKFYHSVLFKKSILISRWKFKKILLYSIDIDSYSTIPYDFNEYQVKILISADERVYLIECNNGFIYESEVGDEYNWQCITSSNIYTPPDSVYWVYNKGAVYIGFIDDNDGYIVPETQYYKFVLSEKTLIKIK